MTVVAMNAKIGTARLTQEMPHLASASMDAQRLELTRLELTRRGRFVFVGLPALLAAALLLLAACALAAGSLASPAQASASHEPVDMADYAVSVTVLQGENLWSIASAADPNRDIRDVVSDIVVLNDLTTGVVQAGQRLYVPLRK